MLPSAEESGFKIKLNPVENSEKKPPSNPVKDKIQMNIDSFGFDSLQYSTNKKVVKGNGNKTIKISKFEPDSRSNSPMKNTEIKSGEIKIIEQPKILQKERKQKNGDDQNLNLTKTEKTTFQPISIMVKKCKTAKFSKMEPILIKKQKSKYLQAMKPIRRDHIVDKGQQQLP